jgi:hypothetical protein
MREPRVPLVLVSQLNTGSRQSAVPHGHWTNTKPAFRSSLCDAPHPATDPCGGYSVHPRGTKQLTPTMEGQHCAATMGGLPRKWVY